MSLKVQLAKFIYWFVSFRKNPHNLFKGLEVDSDDDVLEIGCAIGFHTFPLADLAEDGEIYAVDISEEAIDHVEKKRRREDYQNLKAICKDAGEIDFENKELDKIVCFNTLHDLDEPKEALNNWLDHFKSGGSFLYRDPEISSDMVLDYSDGKLSKAEVKEDVQVFKKT